MEAHEAVPAFYFPELPTASAYAREVIARLQQFCLQLRYTDGTEYISTLPPADLKNLYIAISAIELHLQHGNYAAAQSVLDNLELDDVLRGQNALLREELAVLTLLAAFIKIDTHFQLDEAILLVEKIDQIYISQICAHSKALQSESHKICLTQIREYGRGFRQ
jgi:hypothetical protein